jgi:hypothetical protein
MLFFTGYRYHLWLKKPKINTALPVMKGLLPPVEKEQELFDPAT